MAKSPKKAKKAAKPRKAKAKKSAKAPAASPETSTFISERNLLALARRSDETKTKTASLGKGYRDELGYAEEHQGLNKTAWGIADRLRRLVAKDAPSAQSTIDHLIFYVNTLKLRGKGTKSMNFDAPSKAAPEKPATTPKSGPGTPTPESDLAKVGRGNGNANAASNVTSINEAKPDAEAKAA